MIPGEHLTTSPASLSFGDVELGSSSSRSLTLSNLTADPLTVAIQTSETFTAAPASLTLAANGAAGHSAAVTVTWTPGLTGPVDGILDIEVSHSGVGTPALSSLTMTGTGTVPHQAPALSIFPSALDFGLLATGSSATETVTVTNMGSDSVTLSVVPSSWEIQEIVPSTQQTLGAAGSPTASRTYTVTFDSAGVQQTFDGLLTITGTSVSTGVPVDNVLPVTGQTLDVEGPTDYVSSGAGVLVTARDVPAANPISGNWICPGVADSDCYIYQSPYEPSYTCADFEAGTKRRQSVILDYGLDGNKPGRLGDTVYHFVQANNYSGRPAKPPVGPGSDFTNGGDEFWIFACPRQDPVCENTSPVLVNSSPRPNNPDCQANPSLGLPADATLNPLCQRHSWQLKSVAQETGTLPGTGQPIDQLTLFVKLQNQGVKYPPVETGILEFINKEVVIVANRTTDVENLNETWPGSANAGYENVLTLNSDRRWCDGNYGYPALSNCPPQLELRVTDFVVDRHVKVLDLPQLGTEPTGECLLDDFWTPASGLPRCDLAEPGEPPIRVDYVGFMSWQRDTDRAGADQVARGCGGAGQPPCPVVPAACEGDLDVFSEPCRDFYGCNCCEPSNTGTCSNPYLKRGASYVFVDFRKATYMPKYNAEGSEIIGYVWVKWGQTLDRLPPEHPGIRTRTSTVYKSTVPSGTRWEFWQETNAAGVDFRRNAGGEIVFPACGDAGDPSTWPTTPSSAWLCSANVGTADETQLRNKLRTVRHGIFDPDTGVIQTESHDDRVANLSLFEYSSPSLPSMYSSGGLVTWASGVYEHQDPVSGERRRFYFFGTRNNTICDHVNATNFKIPGTQIEYEEFRIPGFDQAAEVHTLSVTRTGSGTGTVTSTPAGIACGADCSESFQDGQEVHLTAVPAAGSAFAGWIGDSDCADGVIQVLGATACTAIFHELGVLDFADLELLPHGGSQAGNPVIEARNGGPTLYMRGNGWLKIHYPYVITANTRLKFTFKSPTQGDVHGIGFDTDNVVSSDELHFKVYGTQSWGEQDFDGQYLSVAPGWKTYTIPVGDYFTGFQEYLIFANDQDPNGTTAESFYHNVRLYEQ